MKPKLSHSLHNKGAFSLLECLLILVILGILSLSLIPNRSNLNEITCIQTLHQKLMDTNTSLSRQYQTLITHQTPINLAPILQALTHKEDSNCYFSYSKQTLSAFIVGKKLTFTLTPKDWSQKPKISCTLSNPLCQKFLGRKLKK